MRCGDGIPQPGVRAKYHQFDHTRTTAFQQVQACRPGRVVLGIADIESNSSSASVSSDTDAHDDLARQDQRGRLSHAMGRVAALDPWKIHRDQIAGGIAPTSRTCLAKAQTIQT